MQALVLFIAPSVRAAVLAVTLCAETIRELGSEPKMMYAGLIFL